MTEITLKEIEVVKLNLQPGETLVVKIKSDEIDESFMEFFKKSLKPHFPNNEVLIVGMYASDDIEFSTIKDESATSCGPSFCEDCNCGKKERFEA
jgi:hypothetical protein